MAQSNLVDCPPTDSPEETERQPDTSGDNDENLKAEDEIACARDKDLAIPKATVQSTTAENSVHLEQRLEHSDDEMSSNVRSTSQRGCLDTNGESWPERTSLEVSASVESSSHSNENAASGDQELSQIGTMMLERIREKLLFKLGSDTEDVPGLSLIYYGSSLLPMMIKRGQKVDLAWSSARGTLPDEVADAVRRAWPENRDLESIERVILETDGTMPVRKVSWGSAEEYLQRFGDYEGISEVTFFAHESLWHKWCLDAAETRQRQQVKS
ncbi:hypothetical protein CEP53_005216 [Fusarium sp. AF-6]|nr:hypothetical protein CEP53_005216 [Fusarium sp. AF-6]